MNNGAILIEGDGNYMLKTNTEILRYYLVALFTGVSFGRLRCLSCFWPLLPLPAVQLLHLHARSFLPEFPLK